MNTAFDIQIHSPSASLEPVNDLSLHWPFSCWFAQEVQRLCKMLDRILDWCFSRILHCTVITQIRTTLKVKQPKQSILFFYSLETYRYILLVELLVIYFETASTETLGVIYSAHSRLHSASINQRLQKLCPKAGILIWTLRSSWPICLFSVFFSL